MVQAQEYLDQNYPQAQRSEITRLDIKEKNLTGTLNLSNFINLKKLWINNNQEKINQGIYNRFYGSLESLQNLSKLINLNISNTDIDSGLEHLSESVKVFICSTDKRPKAKCQAIYNLLADENGIVKANEYGKVENFPQKLQEYKQKEPWRKLNFNDEEIIQWTDAGAKINDYEFVAWLKNIKKETSEWITNYEVDYQILSQRFKKYGLCSECNQLNTGKQWCQPCNSKSLKKTFKNWTSGNSQIDKFIQKYQLEATNKEKALEWIPYEQFTDIEYLAEGGFGKVYKAKWNNQKVALKVLNNSSNIKEDFLQEVANHKLTDKSLVVPCYGISQDPATKNYIMVMQYISDGNLRKYLDNNYSELDFRDNLSQLVDIAKGLNKIHKQGLIHKDLHPGNILMDGTSCYITDLGLCRPVDEENKRNPYGVLPYMASEVLRNQPYTQASDIYSLGIIACEILSGLSPYYEYAHDEFLSIKICQGLRPKFANSIKLPIISKCLDANPWLRPTTDELIKALNNWGDKIDDGEDEDFFLQCQEAEEFDKTHPQAFYASRLLDFKNLPEPQNSQEINEVFYKLSEELEELRITDSIKFSEELKKRFNNLQIQEKTQEILTVESEEIPPIEIKSNNCGLTKEIENLEIRSKRQLSLEIQTKSNQGESKQAKTIEERHSEPMQIDYDWQNIHLSFTSELINSWQSLNFNYQQIQDWINAGFSPQDYDLVNFVKNNLGYEAETVLNNSHLGLESLRSAYERHLQQEQVLQVNLFNN